jgi:hypothetical protein
MSITEQIAELKSIRRDLKGELRYEKDEEAKVVLSQQLEGIEAAIKTLEYVKAQLVANAYLIGIGA